MGDELDDHSAVAEEQLGTLEVADPGTDNDALAMSELIFSNPSRARSMIEPSDLVDAARKYASIRYTSCMRTSVIFDDRLAAEARELGINVSEAAREGLRQAVRRRRAEQDRAAYHALPEQPDADWEDAEAWDEP